jgi:hypothetical protein
MRQSVRKHYNKLAQFVALGNLGWHHDLLALQKLKPEAEHRSLLRRVNRAFDSKFRALRPQADAPPLFFPDWISCSAEVRQQLYAYALLLRVFDSLMFLTQGLGGSKPGMHGTQLWLEVSVSKGGSMLRVRDPYEDFLAVLSDCDLRRLRSCPVCRQFFVAWRIDQAACSTRCANRLRVARFRQKQPQYSANRKFRKRTGLSAVHHRRRQLMQLSQALAAAEAPEPREPEAPSEAADLRSWKPQK